jgi:parvulin-like peptidyl-prolyl isomerase
MAPTHARRALVAALAFLGGCGEMTERLEPPKQDEWIPFRRIVVASGTATGRTREQARAFAEETLRLARAPGASFEAIARERTEERAEAEGGGFVGFLAPHVDVGPELRSTLDALRPGDVGGPVERSGAFLVLQRLSRDEGRRVEARLFAPVEVVFVRWHAIDRSQPSTRTKEAAYAEAAAAVVALRGGASYEEVAHARELDAPTRELFRLGHGPAEWRSLERAALSTPEGEWGDPVETARGWAVFRREPYLRAHVRHVLVLHSMSHVPSPPTRGRVAASERAREAREKVAADPSAWATVASTYSDEPASAGQGGSIGDVTNVVSPRSAPEFEAAVAALAPGALADDVVETRLGFHVLQRLD